MVLTALTPTSNISRTETNPFDELPSGGSSVTVSDATITEKLLIQARNYRKLVIQIYNDHASKSLDYNLYVNNNYNAGVQPTFDGRWTKIFATDKTLTFGTSDVEMQTEQYQWVIIAFKKTDGTNNSSAKVYVTGFS